MPNFDDGYFISNGIRIHYYRTGGSKPPIILIHGLTDNGLCWKRTVEVLEPLYDLVMVDTRGHGLSDAPERGYSAAEQREDIICLIKSLKLRQPFVIGHSMGAMIAAETGAAYPHLVGGLILEDPPLREEDDVDFETTYADKAKVLENNLITYKTKSIDELIALCRNNSSKWEEPEWLSWAQSKQQANSNVVNYMVEKNGPWRAMAGRLKCPVLLITGENSLGALVSPNSAEEFCKLCGNGHLINISGAGHNIRRDNFNDYINGVLGFMGPHYPA